MKTIDECFYENIHNRICKSILGIRKSSNNLAARAELGRTPLYPFVMGAIFRYWFKLITQSKSLILNEAYKSELELYQKSKLSWLSTVITINDMTKWNVYEKVAMKCIIKEITLDLQNQYKNIAIEHLQAIKQNYNHGKLETYSLLKNDHELESYLVTNMPKIYRVKIASLRIGSHDLEIERGRYSIPKLPREKRICKFCPGEVEDECHFITKCSLYRQKRLDLFTKLGITTMNREKEEKSIFKCLLTEKLLDNIDCQEIGKFIYDCFKLRSAA